MLRAVPKNFFSWDFTFLDGAREVGRLDSRAFRRTAGLEVEGVSYRVHREGLLGDFVLEQVEQGPGPQELARAERMKPFSRAVHVRAGDRRLALHGKWPFLRTFTLLHGDREVGSMSREHWFGRTSTIDFPEEIPLPIRLFMAALVIYRWRQARRRRSG
jgi:hypothetical protein